MSTILQALQKSKLEHSTSPAPVMIINSQPLFWKVAISTALLIIITLLSTLIYLQLTQRNETQPVAIEVIKNEPVIESTPSIEKSHIVKVNFDTQPIDLLPTNVAPEKVIQATKTAQLPQQTVKQQVASTTVASKPKEIPVQQNLNDIEPSNALKERFKMAVLLSDIEENEVDSDNSGELETLGDSTDIHQMSGNFQNKVPLIEYQAHMYSSEQQERWIRINGEVLNEGQFDSTGELELLEIQPQRSIFRLQRQSFSIESLSDWKGY